ETSLPRTTDDFLHDLRAAVNRADGLAAKADALRHAWHEAIVGIGYRDMRGIRNRKGQNALSFDAALRANNLEQTALAEASLRVATEITLESLQVNAALQFTILGLGRLGHAGMDYGSDLDLLIVYDDTIAWDEASAEEKKFGTAQEFYSEFTARLLQILS